VNDYNDEKARIPAWCDRVMWKSLPEAPITQHEYKCVNEITTSDHKPIFSTFTVPCKLPNVPHQPSLCSIYITDLHGSNLVSKDSNGFSDPYIVFTSPILQEEKRTCIIEKTLDPVYPDDEVPTLNIIVSNKEFVQTQHIYMIVRDHDTSTKDDEMGQAAISLKSACGSKPVTFKVPVFLEGVQWGYLEGKIHCKWGTANKKLSKFEGLEKLVELVQTLDDTHSRDILASVMQKEDNAKTVLLALLQGNSVHYGGRIRAELEAKAPEKISRKASKIGIDKEERKDVARKDSKKGFDPKKEERKESKANLKDPKKP